MEGNSNRKLSSLGEELARSIKYYNDKTLEEQIRLSNFSAVSESTNITVLINKLCQLYLEYEQNKATLTFYYSLPVIFSSLLASAFQKVFIKFIDSNISEPAETCYCKEPILNTKQVTKCNYCNITCHKDCVFFPYSDSNYQCPSCFIKTLDPFSEVKQTKIMSQIKLRDKYLEYEIDLSNVERGDAVEFRCIKIDSDYLYNSQISWPDHCEIFVNGVEYVRMRPLPYNSSLKKRQDGSLTLPDNQFLKKTKVQFKNKIQNDRRQYRLKACVHLFGVFVVKKQSVSALCSSILATMPNETVYRCAFRDRYKANNKFVQLERERIIMDCPYTKSKMTIPARGNSCLHLECFDLHNFLVSNKLSRTFKCPIFRCIEKCHTLIVDPVLYNIIKNDDLNQVEAVEFSLDGAKPIMTHVEAILIESDEEEAKEAVNSDTGDFPSYPEIDSNKNEIPKDMAETENGKECISPGKENACLAEVQELSEQSSSMGQNFNQQPSQLLAPPFKQQCNAEPTYPHSANNQNLIEISDSQDNEEQRVRKLIRVNTQRISEQKQKADVVVSRDPDYDYKLVRDIYSRLCTK